MPPQAYALVTLFTLCSILLGILAVRLMARFGGPRGLRAYPLPIIAGFLAFYLVGHKLGLAVGPEITLFGFQVTLLGDMAFGFAAAIAVAAVQTALARARARGRSATRA